MSGPFVRRRDDVKWIEGITVAFAMYCDENSLSKEEGLSLAESLGDSLFYVADDRTAE